MASPMDGCCGGNGSSDGSCSCGGGCGSGMCDMHMTFFWSVDLGKFFFKGMNINTVPLLLLTCFVFALLSVLYEGIKVSTAAINSIKNDFHNTSIQISGV